MPEYSVTITLASDQPLTEDELFEVAALGGAASGREGGSELTTTLTVDAPTVSSAIDEGLALVGKLVSGNPIAVEVLTVAEHDRRLAEPAFPALVGVAELAEMLGVSRQRASALPERADFPSPVAVLRAGPVWRRGDVSQFVASWPRTSGRPTGQGSSART